MRDIVWTIIIIWVVWKIYESFKTVTKPKTQQSYNTADNQKRSYHEGKTTVNSTDSKNKSHLDPNIGEYVDYEEVK